MITIVVAGPQGTGKTTLALALGRKLGVPVFSRDPLMAALLAGQPRVLRRYLAVECACSDPAVHRERVESRAGVSWRQVAATIRCYQPDPQADVLADAMRPVSDLVAQIASMAE